jgi:hypothetical protein
VINFKSFFKQNKDTRRHMRDRSHSPGKFARFIPKSHQVDPNENQKYVRVKNNRGHREVLSSRDLHQLMQKYHFKPDLKSPITIDSKNGIVVSYEDGRFILKAK